jgi:hypothetical protein
LIKAIPDEHVTLTVKCLDRLYLNCYSPSLQTEAGWDCAIDGPLPAHNRASLASRNHSGLTLANLGLKSRMRPSD